MARTSKMALLVAGVLAACAILAGSAITAPAPAAPAGFSATAETHASTASSGNDTGPNDGRQIANDWKGHSRGVPYMRDRAYAGSYWTLGEILQWLAIGLLAGAAAALMIWRPWRRAAEPFVPRGIDPIPPAGARAPLSPPPTTVAPTGEAGSGAAETQSGTSPGTTNTQPERAPTQSESREQATRGEDEKTPPQV